MAATSQLKPCRLVVTTHTEGGGISVFASDDNVEPFVLPFGPLAPSFANFHAADSVPASNMATLSSLDKTLPRCPPTGVIFATTDIQPGASAPMHRTESLDYIVVVAGVIVLGLDSGEERTIRAGEDIVQRSVNLRW